MAKKELKKLREQNPDFLKPEPKAALVDKIIHFLFASLEDGERITIPICGTVDEASVGRRSITQVTCPDCLEALDNFAALDNFQDALDAAAVMVPEIITPDPEKMNERIGTERTREARQHIKAQQFLQNRGCKDPAKLNQNMIGSSARTFYKNLYEIGLIDQDGDLSGFTAAQLAAGADPDQGL